MRCVIFMWVKKQNLENQDKRNQNTDEFQTLVNLFPVNVTWI